MPAQGNALGIGPTMDQALKGRPKRVAVPMCRPFRVLSLLIRFPRALPWAGMGQAVGLHLASVHFLTMPRPYFFLHCLRLLATALLLSTAVGAEKPPFNPGESAAHFPQETTVPDRAPKERPTSFADVVKRITPSVVSVFPARLAKPGEVPEDELLKRFFGAKKPDDGEDDRFHSVGSGVIISADGYILTNSHVVHLQSGKLADEIVVELSNKWRLPAKIIGADPKVDIAVIKIDAKDLPALPMADSARVEVGDLVFAVGNPFKVGITATMGMVSATHRSGIKLTGADGYEDFIQTDAAINPGNSGGALCDARGRLVGINTAIVGGFGGNVGIGFAVTVNLARRVLFNVLENGEPVRGFAGLRVKSVDDAAAHARKLAEVRGAMVEEVLDAGPAAKAGLKKGDVILRVGDEDIGDAPAFRIATAFAAPGAKLVLHYVRDGEPGEVSLTVTKQDDTATAGTAMEIESLPGVRLREQGGADGGLLVEVVAADSAFAKQLAAGMVILEINDTKIPTRAAAAAALQPGPNKVRVRREELTETLSLRVK